MPVTANGLGTTAVSIVDGVTGLPVFGPTGATSSATNSSTPTTDLLGQTVAAGTNFVYLGASPTRQFISVSNTGANPLMVRFGGAGNATTGIPLAPGATLVFDNKCPTGQLNVFSTLGTTFYVIMG